MQKTEDTKTTIMDVAERMIRHGGYNAFSFREIASEIGIKSASIHYHFPTKADLGAAVAARYTERFLENLASQLAEAETPVAPVQVLEIYVDAFRAALEQDSAMCLCGMLGAEQAGLPEPVAAHAKDFFQRNKDWLTTSLRRPGESENAIEIRALHVMAALEGALILARSMEDPGVFVRVATELLLREAG